MLKEEQILDKTLEVIDKSLDGENVPGIYTAIELCKDLMRTIYLQRAEKERIRQEVWADKIEDKEK